MNGWWRSAALLLLVLTACSRKEQSSSADAALSDASSTAVAETDSGTPAAPPRELTPGELLEEYRRTLSALADQGKYTEVCKGAPWFNQVICAWAAARANGKAVERPDGELFRAFFGREHWNHVYGTIIDAAGNQGDYEVSVGGYRNHCILDTADTKYETRGRFDLWVQEQPEPREVDLNSGKTANWVVLEEEPLAKALMGLAHSGVGVESTATAKDAMGMIASYVTYAERKGQIPPVPGAAPQTASGGGGPTTALPVGTSTTAPVASPVATGAPKAAAATATPAAPKNPRARADCLAGCVSKCADDAACERTCAGKCPGT